MENVSSRRYLSLWLRRLATDRLTRHWQRPVDPRSDRRPLALTGTVKSARRLTAVNDAAARLGLRVGMSFADACSIHPHLDCAEADPEADARVLLKLAEWCEIYTPLVGIDPPDGLILDVTGVTHLFGGETVFARNLAKRLTDFGWHARIGIADTVGAAWASARYGKTAIIPSGQTDTAMTPLPLGALRLSQEICDGLRQLGLKTVGDLMIRPRAPLAARFGQKLIQRLDQMLGRQEESITPLMPVPALCVEQGFPEPLLRDEDLMAVLARLGERLCAMLETRGQGARQMKASFFAVDGRVFRLQIGTSLPLRDSEHLYRLFADKFGLAKWDNEFGFDRIRLSVLEAESLSPSQKDLTADNEGPELSQLIDRLSARLGEARVLRLMLQDTHVPEHASVALPAASAKEFDPSFPFPETKKSEAIDQDSLGSARPLRLLERAEPVDATAEIPDGPPVKFTWRRVVHGVARVEGPERITMPWWLGRSTSPAKGEADLTRDYFRVQTANGARLWLYREGFYGDSTPPRWFLHGFLP